MYTLYSDWYLQDPTGLRMDRAGDPHKLHRPITSDSGETCWFSSIAVGKALELHLLLLRTVREDNQRQARVPRTCVQG